MGGISVGISCYQTCQVSNIYIISTHLGWVEWECVSWFFPLCCDDLSYIILKKPYLNKMIFVIIIPSLAKVESVADWFPWPTNQTLFISLSWRPVRSSEALLYWRHGLPSFLPWSSFWSEWQRSNTCPPTPLRSPALRRAHNAGASVGDATQWRRVPGSVITFRVTYSFYPRTSALFDFGRMGEGW